MTCVGLPVLDESRDREAHAPHDASKQHCLPMSSGATTENTCSSLRSNALEYVDCGGGGGGKC